MTSSTVCLTGGTPVLLVTTISLDGGVKNAVTTSRGAASVLEDLVTWLLMGAGLWRAQDKVLTKPVDRCAVT